MTERDDLTTRIASIQGPILEAARSSFTDREIEDLRCVVRLAVEFEDYIQRLQFDAIDAKDLDYLSGSVLAGVDCFSSVAKAYGALVGATSSRVSWNTISALGSLLPLREYYLTMYEEFSLETSFENKCRLLLDLFKVQLVFVGVLYAW